MPASNLLVEERPLVVLLDSTGKFYAVNPQSGSFVEWMPPETALSEILTHEPFQLGRNIISTEKGRARMGLSPDTLDPAFSSDGKHVVYTRLEPATGAQPLVLRNLITGEERVLASFGQVAQWSPNGKSVAFLSGDFKKGRTLSSVIIAESSPRVLAEISGNDVDSFWWAPDGNSIYFTARVFSFESKSEEGSLYRIDIENGKVQSVFVPPAGGRVADPQISASGQVAVRLWEPRTSSDLVSPANLAIMESGGPRSLLKVEAREQSYFTKRGGYSGVERFMWSPDGRSLIFVAALEGDCRSGGGATLRCQYDVYSVDAVSGSIRRLTRLRFDSIPRMAWLP